MAASPVRLSQPVAVELSPGTTVGEYIVQRKLGEGGMGTVYAGEQPTIGKLVAIKVLAPHCANDPELLRRFVEEARAANRIRHPNIIDIFSFGQLSDLRLYFVMEFLDGESLAEAIDKGAIRPNELRRLLCQICGALEASHQVGIVHRDLKPENIWIARPLHGESYVKLLDFGIAKLLDPTRTNLPQTGAVMGTPLFMAPEQCMGREIDARTDIYALGVILYRIFAGQLPFQGTVITELVFRHVTEEPAPHSRHRAIRLIWRASSWGVWPRIRPRARKARRPLATAWRRRSTPGRESTLDLRALPRQRWPARCLRRLSCLPRNPF